MKFSITEPVFFLGKDRKPGEVLDNPTGPYKYQPGTGKRIAQFVELPSENKPVVQPPPIPTPLPAVSLIEPKPIVTKPMTAPEPGSFAASLKAMLDEAKSGLAQARADGMATVKEAVGKLNDAKTATAHVAGTMAKTIEDEAASAMSELGQISNDLGV